jgi:hypothetical protein
MGKLAISGEIVTCDTRVSLSQRATNWAYVSIREADGMVTHVKLVRAEGPIASAIFPGSTGTFHFMSSEPRLLYGVRHSDGRVDKAEKRSLVPSALAAIWSLAAIFILIGFVTLPMSLIAMNRSWQFNRAIDDDFGPDSSTVVASEKTRTI